MPWLISDALMKAYENSRSSQAQAAESLVDTCSDGEPSAQSNGNLTQQAYLQHDRMTAFSRLSRFGMTFRPLTADRGEDLLMWYREDFLARIFQSQGEARVLMERDQDSGEKWRGWLARFDPASSTLKTVQCSLFGGGGTSYCRPYRARV
jgi:hypothetical protein